MNFLKRALNTAGWRVSGRTARVLAENWRANSDQCLPIGCPASDASRSVPASATSLYLPLLGNYRRETKRNARARRTEAF
jgi:hypothetical protein